MLAVNCQGLTGHFHPVFIPGPHSAVGHSIWMTQGEEAWGIPSLFLTPYCYPSTLELLIVWWASSYGFIWGKGAIDFFLLLKPVKQGIFPFILANLKLHAKDISNRVNIYQAVVLIELRCYNYSIRCYHTYKNSLVSTIKCFYLKTLN